MIQGAAMSRVTSQRPSSRSSSFAASDEMDFGGMTNGVGAQELTLEIEKLRRDKLHHILEMEKFKVKLNQSTKGTTKIYEFLC